MPPASPTIPLLVFFDLDGTLVGDVSYMICQWEIARKFPFPSCMKILKNEISFQLRSGILRPFISKTLHRLNELYEGRILFFVYTASEKTWAEFLVPCIERELNIKFQRPILSRRDCLLVDNRYQKSLKTVLPKVLPTVHRASGYPMGSLQSHHLIEHCVLVDNTFVIVNTEQFKLIKCPSYQAVAPFDILKQVPSTVIFQNWKAIAHILYGYNILPKQYRMPVSFNQFYILYYANLAKALNQYGELQHHRKDTFFETLLRSFMTHRVRDLRKHSVKRIVDSIHIS